MCSAYIDVLTVSMTSKIVWAEPPAVAMPSKFGKLWPRDREPARIHHSYLQRRSSLFRNSSVECDMFEC